jgi:outer membrane receptor protein involved in Fe transport
MSPMTAASISTAQAARMVTKRRVAVALTRRIALNGGFTKAANALNCGGDHRVYVDSAPHFVASGALMVAPWRGWSGSRRLGAIDHYRLDGNDPAIVASGHTVLDLGVSRRLSRVVELNLAIDNLTDRDYYETQNDFESRVASGAPIVARIHGTPGYPLAAVVGLTFRLRAK